jgi:arylsulfatase A-like enzyme
MAHASGPLRSVYDELYFQYCQRIASAPAESLDQLRRFPSADLIVDEASAWLAERGQSPFFLWLHLMDAHSPYYPCDVALQEISRQPSDAWQARYLNSYWNRGDLSPARLKRHRTEIVNLYDAGIRWVDSQVARLVQNLRRLGDWENCVFALTADHGEEFLEHQGRYHPPSNLHEELIRVPLLLRTPDAKTFQSIAAPFSLIHFAPTLLAQMNVGSPESFRGIRHVFDQNQSVNRDEAVVVECIAGCTNPLRKEMRLGNRIMALRNFRFKLVIDLGSGEEKLFDLQADPEEKSIAYPRDTGIRRKLLEVAQHHLRETRRMRDPSLRLSARVRDLRQEQIIVASRVSLGMSSASEQGHVAIHP